MKTTKLFIVSAIFAFFCIASMHAQSYETISKWDKKNASCVAIDVNAPEKIAIESLYDLLKSEHLKGKKSSKTVSFEKIVFPSLGNEYINLYATVSPKDNNNSTVYVFINRGINTEFLTSTSDAKLIDNLKSYLNDKYAPAAAKANLDAKVSAHNKLIKDSSKDLEKLQKNVDKKRN